MTFGERLRSYRKSRGATLQQVADAAGCTKAYVWELEKRPDKNPTADRLNKIAKFLDVSVQDLLGEPVVGDIAPSAEDVIFFREYLALDSESKRRYQAVLKLMQG